jgi:molybdate transport repressor ModE-like protein
MVSPHTDPLEPVSAQLPDWDDFRLLLAVAQLGSITRAAAALGVSQPTVSRRVERLEEAIGARLLDRSQSGAALTPDGQRIVEELNVAHGAILRAVQSVHGAPARLDGVKLVTTDGMAAYWLPRFMAHLFRQSRDLELRVFTTSEAREEQRGQNFDLSIHYIQPTDPNLVAVRLGTLHFMPYASPGYLAECGTPQSVEELSHHRLLDYILYVIDKGTWMTRLPAIVGEARAQYFTNSSAALCESVRNGAGIALLPTYISVYESGLVPLDVDLRFETPFWLCYRQCAGLRPSMRAAIAFLKQIFSRRTMPWFADTFVPPPFVDVPTPADFLARLSLDGQTNTQSASVFAPAIP